MKKRFLIFAAIFCMGMNLFGQALNYIDTGDYAYYLDIRYGEPILRGYMIAHIEGKDLYVFCNVRRLEKKQSWNFVLTGPEPKDGEFKFANIIGADEILKLPKEEKAMITQSIPDFLNFHMMRYTNKNKIEYGNEIEDKWDNYSLYYCFNRIVPFFNFSAISIKFKDHKEGDEFPVVYNLVKAGNLDLTDEKNAELFTKMDVNWDIKPIKTKSLKMPESEPMNVEMCGQQITLDTNWKEHEENGNKTYWLSVNTIRDAQLMLEPLDEKHSKKFTIDLQEKVLKVLLNAYEGAQPIYNLISVKKEINYLRASVVLLDKENQLNIVRVYMTKKYIINFSCFYDVWAEHNDYFKAIINSIDKNPK